MEAEHVAFRAHDHRRCRTRAMDAARETCAAQRLRLTPSRAFVLETLLEAHRALSAYELLERLDAAGLGSQPPVVYRALDFLLSHGFVHRIERLSAFVACTHGGAEHTAAFIVCRRCRAVAETAVPKALSALGREAAAAGVAVEGVSIEAEGVCMACRGGA